MIKIIMGNHKAIEWVSDNKNYFRGWFFDKNGFHEKKDALCFFNSMHDEFGTRLNQINGNYSCIYTSDDKTFVAVDRIRSFPLFYIKSKKDVYISDSVEKLKDIIGDLKVETEHLQELIATGYVTGRKTIYKEIYQVQAGEYLIIDNETGNIEFDHHYLHKHKQDYNKDIKELCEELDLVLLNVFKRLIKSVKGKPIALFLSGGYDSRLVATMLKRLKYENVYCISFGKTDNKEVIAAQDVANSLGTRWELITFPRNYLRKMLDDEDFQKYIIETGNGTNLPYYQGVLAGEFIKRGLIPENSVILTGNSGDLLEGDQLDSRFQIGQLYSKEMIINSIIETHYMAFGKSLGEKKIFRKYVSEMIEDKNSYSYEECHDICEFFNWRERQSKFVVNDVRCYDEFLGNEWRLPLWDSEFMDFWLKVPTELRCNRKLYYEYVKEEKFMTANNPTLYRKLVKYIKKHFMFLIELLYPVAKVKDYIFEDTPFYLVSFKDFLNIIRITKGYRTNPITTHAYMELNKFYKDYFNSINKLVK